MIVMLMIVISLITYILLELTKSLVKRIVTKISQHGGRDAEEEVTESIDIGNHLRVMKNGSIDHYKCKECEYVTKNKTNLGNHLEKKHMGISIPFSKCPKMLGSSHALI